MDSDFSLSRVLGRLDRPPPGVLVDVMGEWFLADWTTRSDIADSAISRDVEEVDEGIGG